MKVYMEEGEVILEAETPQEDRQLNKLCAVMGESLDRDPVPRPVNKGKEEKEA